MNSTFKPSIGSWLNIGSPAVAELAALCGFDWLLFDLEHGCEAEAALPDQLRALRGTSTRAIVRVGAPHPDAIARALDWGAHGIMIPHVNTVAEAAACVDAMRYPPHGHRGVSRSTRACDYGLRPLQIDPPPLFMAQLETIDGVRNAREIAAVEGVDVLFVGPADLQFDLQARPEAADGNFEACLAYVAEAARAAGKQCGILVRDTADLPHLLALGYTQLAIDSDLAILRRGYQQILTEARKLPE